MPDRGLLVKTRREALAAGVDLYFTGKPCPHGHVAPRRVSGACCDCARLTKAAWQKVNAQRLRPLKAANQRKHRATASARSRRWYAKHREQANAATAAWQRRNPGKVAAKATRRRAAVMQRTPQWADAQKIARAYELAAGYRARGIDAHVDHIIPLQGEMVCGLHVHDNLQIISGDANRIKSNRFMKGI